MTSVSSQVEALSTTVNGIINSLTMLGENAAGIEAGLMTAQKYNGKIKRKETGIFQNTR